MISSQFIQSCQSGDESAIQTLVRTYQRPVFQLALSIIDDGPEAKPDSDAYKGVTAEAEAATRQTFITAIDRMGRYREGTNFETWLYGIAIQVSRERARSWKTRQGLRGLLLRSWNALTRRDARQQADLEELKSAPLLRTNPVDSANKRPAAEELPAAKELPGAKDLPGAKELPAAKELPGAKDLSGEKTPLADARYHSGDLELWSAVRQLDEKLRVAVVLRYYHDFPISEIAHLLHISEGTVHARLDAARERIARARG